MKKCHLSNENIFSEWKYVPWMPEVFSLANGKERQSE